MSVSIDGSASKDQVCGLKVEAALKVPGAVSDIDAFKAAIENAAAGDGDANVVVEITAFEQKIESTASCPGTAATYSSDAAQQQFKAGILAAVGGVGTVGDLCIDGQSWVGGTPTACSRRRLLDTASATSSRRRLNTVDIEYDVTVDDPAVAATMATQAQDTAAFAETLATAVNDAGSGLTLAPDDIAVSEPAIETAIEYDVVVQTTDSDALDDVSATLSSATDLQSALAATVDTGGAALVIDSSDLEAVAVCSRPAAAGYAYTETSLTPGASFDVTAACADGYESAGTPTVSECPAGGQPFVLGGDLCTPIVCVQPTGAAAAGYEFTETNLDLSTGDFAVAVSCSTTPSTEAPGGYQGTAAAAACTTSGAYTVSGCTEAPVQCDSLLSTSPAGYVLSAEDSLAPGTNSDALDITVVCDSAAGYGGVAVASPCEMSQQPYTLSGCSLECTEPADAGYVYTDVCSFTPGSPASCTDNPGCSYTNDDAATTDVDEEACTGKQRARGMCFSTDENDFAGIGDFDACAAVVGDAGDCQLAGACTYRRFEVEAACADGYESAGTPTVSQCSADGQPFVLGGDPCTPMVCVQPTGAAAAGYEFTETNLDLSTGAFAVEAVCTGPSAEYPGGFDGTAVAAACVTSGEYTVSGCTEQPVQCESTSKAGYVVTEESLAPGADGEDWDVTATCAEGYEGTAIATPCEINGPYTLSGCTVPVPPEEEGGSAGAVIGIILGIVAVGVIAFFGVKAMKSKGGGETTGARPSMLSPSAAAYQTDDVDPEDTSTRPGRKLSF
jgi:hypothetical protein